VLSQPGAGTAYAKGCHRRLASRRVRVRVYNQDQVIFRIRPFL